MEENQNIENNNPQQEASQTAVHTEPVMKKKANPGLILGIIGTATGTLALLIVILMGIAGISARAHLQDNLRDNLQDRREQMIETRQNQPGMRGAFQNDNDDACTNCPADSDQ